MGDFELSARALRVAMVIAFIAGCSGGPSAPAPLPSPAPVPIASPVPVAVPAAVSNAPAPVVSNAPAPALPNAPAPASAAAPSPVLGSGDPIAFAHPPPAALALHAPLEAPWDAVRALLAATPAISRGTRVGYRPIADSRVREGSPVTFATPGAHTFGAPTWWRSGASTLLVVPYLLPGERGGLGTALYEHAPDGLRYATHVPEQPIDQACTSPASVWAIAADGSELRMLTGCVDYVPTLTTFRIAGTSIAVTSGGVSEAGAPMDGAMRDPRAPTPAPTPPTTEPSSREELLMAALCCALPDEEGCVPDDPRPCEILGSRPRCEACMVELQEDGVWLDDERAQIERRCGAACR